MRRSPAFAALLGLLLSAWAAMPWAATQLNGLATHNELGSERFIGALYLESLSSDRNQILNTNTSKRMELRVTAEDGIAARRFSRMWIEGMAINNTSTMLTEQADNMVAFSNTFKNKLEQNDVVAFSMEPGQGVEISLNGVVLDTIEEDEFFNLLLRTWIGNVPLSSTYRASLLQGGDVDSGLRSRFDAIAPSEARRAEVVAWTQEEESQSVAAAPSDRTTPDGSSPEVDAGIPAIALDLPPPDLRTRREPEAEPEPVQETAPQPAPEPEPVAEEDEEEDEPILTAESLRAQQVYFSDLMRSIQGNTEYPRRAMQRNQQGEVRVAVVINRAGEILSTELLDESRHSMLNRAAIDAIERAAPFPGVPSAISGRRYEFSVPFNFVLPD